MKIEIWSDVACPWCYIGKKRFEKALEQFPHADKIGVEWKSFLLNPDQTTDPDESLLNYLAREKGLAKDQVAQMMAQVSHAGKGEGIEFNFDQVVLANTVRAHALIQMAKEKGLGAEVKQRLLHAYFSENKNVDQAEELISIGVDAGMEASEIKAVLATDHPFKKVEQDLKEASALGIRGVPFFVIDRKYAISGAQETSVFLQALEQSFAEWQKKQSDGMEIIDGASCDADGCC